MAKKAPKKVPARVKQALREQAVQGKVSQPDLSRLVSHFFLEAGGESGIARLLLDEFRGAKQGSVTRQRILDLIIRSLKSVNEMLGTRDDIGELTEEEIDRELDALVEAEVAKDGENDQPARPAECGGQAAPAGPAAP